MANFDEIDEARRMLGLGEEATAKEIKNAYRKKAFAHHPDRHIDTDLTENTEIMKKLNWAYKLLTKYCNDYKYAFKQDDVARTYPQEDDFKKWHEKWFDSI
jgi:DnaJ-class molecular chaperone